jgi:hypothetical protein
MSDAAVSPDGAWRWNGSQWVPNVDSRPPVPPPGAYEPMPQSSPSAQRGLGTIGILALVFVGLALAMIVLQVCGDTIRAFSDNPSYENPWYYKFWSEVAQFALATAGLALGVITAVRTRSVLGILIAVGAGGAFLQSFLIVFYRVVVNHWGYGSDLFY